MYQHVGKLSDITENCHENVLSGINNVAAKSRKSHISLGGRHKQ